MTSDATFTIIVGEGEWKTKTHFVPESDIQAAEKFETERQAEMKKKGLPVGSNQRVWDPARQVGMPKSEWYK